MACASPLVFAQTSNESAPVLGVTTTVPAVEPALGMLKRTADAGIRLSATCTLEVPKKLPNRALVVVVRKVSCVSRYGGNVTTDFFEVLYAGNERLVPVDAVFMTNENEKRVAAIEPDQIEASTEKWRRFSLIARKNELDQAIAAIDATGKHGITLFKSSIFDVSDYTEGTGFKATVLNSSKKTIKYVSFTVAGLNAVGDPVLGNARGGASPTLRGIGPIAPGETASYSKDYMWMTDVVQSYRIRSIKVEYTDGSSKVVSDVKKIQISAQDYEALMTDD